MYKPTCRNGIIGFLLQAEKLGVVSQKGRKRHVAALFPIFPSFLRWCKTPKKRRIQVEDRIHSTLHLKPCTCNRSDQIGVRKLQKHPLSYTLSISLVCVYGFVQLTRHRIAGEAARPILVVTYLIIHTHQ